MTQPEPVQDTEQTSPDAAPAPVYACAGALTEDRLELDDAESLDVVQEGDDESDVEEPDDDDPLPTYDAMQLNRFLLQQIPAGYYLPPDNLPQHAPPRSLYDWFVGAMNVAPLCDKLLDFAERLAIWRKNRGTRKGTNQQRGNRRREADDASTDWTDPRSLPV